MAARNVALIAEQALQFRQRFRPDGLKTNPFQEYLATAINPGHRQVAVHRRTRRSGIRAPQTEHSKLPSRNVSSDLFFRAITDTLILLRGETASGVPTAWIGGIL